MKNLSLVLNIILVLAVGYLYIDEFTDSNDPETNEMSETADAVGGKFAYVNSDSLLANYNYYEEVATALDEKRGKLQTEYLRRAEALQKQIEDFQRTYTNMTVPQAQAVEENLMQRRQSLGQYQESISQQLMQEEALITQRLYENLSNYLKKYGAENNLQIVFTYTPGSGLLYANEGLDITDQVIEALNLEHEQGNNTMPSDSTGAQ